MGGLLGVENTTVERVEFGEDTQRLVPHVRPSRQIREGAGGAELTGLLDVTGWPPGMRVLAR